MASIYLLRHCEYDNPRNILVGRLPVSLSDEGRKKAGELAGYFAKKNIARIYASAVERSKQTAEIIAQGRIPIIFDHRILETLSAYQGYWEENWHGEGFHFFSHRQDSGGEGLADIHRRVKEFWDEVTDHLQENIIICSHGDPLQVLFSYIYQLPLVDENEQEKSIPGWLEKGEFVEVTLENNKLVGTQH